MHENSQTFSNLVLLAKTTTQTEWNVDCSGACSTQITFLINGAPYTFVNVDSPTHFFVTNLTPGQTYTLTVCYTSPFSGSCTGSTSANFQMWPEIYSISLNVLSKSTKTLELSSEVLGGVPGGTTYTYTRDGSIICQDVTVSCIMTNLTPATTYSIQVTAVNDGISLYTSSPVSTNDIVKISSFKILDITSSTAIATYSSMNGTPGKNYYTISINSTDYGECSQTLAPTCLIKGLSPLSTYTIGVTAQSDGYSDTRQQTIQTFQDITIPTINVFQYRNQTLEIKYLSLYGSQNLTLYTTKINGTTLSNCNNISQESCILQYDFDKVYEIEVIATNGPSSKSSTTTYTTFKYLTGVEITSQVTISEIIISWNKTNGGDPSSTFYIASFSEINKGGFIMTCNATTDLKCTFPYLVQNTNYQVKVVISSNNFDPVESIISVKTNLDTNNYCLKEVNSLECNGKGTCNNSVCICQTGWIGQYCDIEYKLDLTNPPVLLGGANYPTISTKNNGVENTFKLFELKEVDITNNIVKALDLTALKWLFINATDKNFSSQYNGEMVERSWQYSTSSSQYFKSINITFYQYLSDGSQKDDYYQYNYIDQIYRIKFGSFKYTFNISEWNFDSHLNVLELSSIISSPIGGSCDSITKLTNNDAGDIQYISLEDSNGNSILGRIINKIILDGIPRTIGCRSEDASDTETKIISTIPYFEDQLFFDPDFSLLVKIGESSTECKDDNKWKIIVGSVVGGVAFITIVALATIIIIKKKNNILIFFGKSSLTSSSNKLKRFN